MGIFKHPTAAIETTSIGENTKIWQYVVILHEAVIGENCNINCHCFVENDVIVGNNVTIKCGVYLWDGIVIEDDVFVGPNVTFTNDLRPRSKKYPSSFDKTVLKKSCSIGAGAVIVGGVSIGEYAMIGAGSVVTKSIPAFTLWYGNPAKLKSYVCRCGQKLSKKLICPDCKAHYKLSKAGLTPKK